MTRDSIIQIARARGYTVSEEPVPVADAMDADEVRRALGRCPWSMRSPAGDLPPFRGTQSSLPDYIRVCIAVNARHLTIESLCSFVCVVVRQQLIGSQNH